jgi:hypothetical protein
LAYLEIFDRHDSANEITLSIEHVPVASVKGLPVGFDKLADRSFRCVSQRVKKLFGGIAPSSSLQHCWKSVGLLNEYPQAT